MTYPKLRRALWICDYFPRPHDLTSGTWALENVVALQAAGLPAVVLAPTPWIPRLLAVSNELRAWSRVPPQHEIRGVPVYYPRCPHYPRRWVHNGIYSRVPFLDSALLWPWCKGAVERMMEHHPFDVVHANFLFPAGYLGLRLKERFGTPLVVHERSVQRLAQAREHAARGRLYRHILKSADLVVTENSRMAAELREMEPAITDLKVLVQPGTHPDMVERQKQPRPGAFADRKVIVSVGALSERKGHEYLIRAVAELRNEFPDLACRIIGDGPERQKLKDLVRQLGLADIVELRGKRPHAEVLGDMSWCDVFALASWGEASGTVYGEAMQFGKPVIACADEGIAEVLRDQEHGRLVPTRNVAALAEALRWLFADSARRERIGEQARTLANEELSYPHMARTLIDVYGKLSDAAKRGRSPADDVGRADAGCAKARTDVLP
jgi:glycosyltransferase involved in cell wall biosynthesis